MNMHVCLVKHDGCDKPFLFGCSALFQHQNLEKGMRVICDTRYGESEGTLITAPITIAGTEEDVAKLFQQMGADKTLKQVLRVVPRSIVLTAWERRSIALQWVAEELSKPQAEVEIEF